MQETPMMKQFNGFKRQYPDKVVLFRMGDFFETFGEDAKTASRVLNITLTSRDKKKDSPPMAGFPHHALNQYLPKFIKAGHCVVVVNQLEDPKLAKGIVKRGVTRIVTPGTLEEDESSYTKNIFLVSFCKIKNTLGVGVIDISTGNLKVCDCPFSSENVERILNSFEPGEILLLDSEQDISLPGHMVQFLEGDFLKSDEYEKVLKDFYKVRGLNSLNLKRSLPSCVCAGMILSYVAETQKTNPEHISTPEFFNLDGTMYLDSSTIRNLDLVYNSATGSVEGSLLSIVDETKTNMGVRELHNWLLRPLLDHEQVNRRLNIVDYFFQRVELLNDVRDILGRINDLERLVGRIGLNRANARDYKAIEYSLLEVEGLFEKLKDLNKKESIFSQDLFLEKTENSLKNLATRIGEVIKENPPLLITEGFLVKDGYNQKVDELRNISGTSKNWVKEFAIEEKKKTGISNLKIGFNRVFGYYIEVSKINQSKVPDEYIRKQTLVNSERYITEDLKEKEDEILNAESKLSELEFELFQEFRTETLPYIENIKKIAAEIAFLDVLQGFAYCAMQNNYVKPEVLNIGIGEKIIDIKDSRHPVIEALSEEEFVSNDILLNDGQRRMNILTGPNMSGKSTYIRQIALSVLLAQIGCFIPASSGTITMVDRIFTRVGASDDLIRGRSTFMVEMDEASNILNNATENSLVILDEIGRGTSTYDGVSIAWALAEYLIREIEVRTMFATHYHELLALSESNPDLITNLNVQVDEDEEKEEVVFLRKIVEGGTDRSYGIHVAKLAGLPDEVVKRAYEILTSFEQTAMFSKKNVNIPVAEKMPKKEQEEINQLSFLPDDNNRLLRELKKLDLDKLTPIEALNKLNKWRKKYLN
jgi:DNA mismatch repair protein MutS